MKFGRNLIEFFNNNDFEVIMDKDEKESFIHFMDRINECKYVIMILNNFNIIIDN